MFNPFTYQGGTATIDGQTASLNGHSRIPEFVTNGIGQNPLGVGYPQTYGYPTAFPGITGQTVINPMTGLPVTTPAAITGIPNMYPAINPMTGYNGIGGYPAFVNGQFPVNTPWGLGTTYPTIPNVFNAIPATTFGIPAIQPFFGAGLTLNPFTGVAQPAFNPFTGYGQPMGMNTNFGAPVVTNPWMNPYTTAIVAQAIQHALITGVPVAALPAYFGIPGTIPNTVGFPNAFGVNPLAGAINPLAAVAATNATVCGGCMTGVTTPGFVNSFVNRAAGFNPIANAIPGFAYNPYANLGIGWNPAINNVIGTNPTNFGAFNCPTSGVGTPWNTTGAIHNPWINSFAQNWTTGANYAVNPLTGWMNPAMAHGNYPGATGFGYNGIGGAVAPVTPGLINSAGCWPNCCI